MDYEKLLNDCDTCDDGAKPAEGGEGEEKKEEGGEEVKPEGGEGEAVAE